MGVGEDEKKPGESSGESEEEQSEYEEEEDSDSEEDMAPRLKPVFVRKWVFSSLLLVNLKWILELFILIRQERVTIKEKEIEEERVKELEEEQNRLREEAKKNTKKVRNFFRKILYFKIKFRSNRR